MEGGILPSHQELLSRIELVCDLDSSFIALTGDAGTGKSTVLEYFIENHCAEHRKCFIQASKDQSPDHIKEQVLLQLFTAQTVDTRHSLSQNALQNTFETLTQVIVIIDNGQFIDSLVFDELIELLKTPIDNFQASVIFALPDDRELFSALNAKHPLIEIHIELLNRAESRLLLEYYYQEMMDSDRLEVQRFIDRCEGNPGQLLTWQSEHGGGTKRRSKISPQTIVLTLAAALLIAVVGAASWYFITTGKDVNELQIEQLRAKVEAEKQSQDASAEKTEQPDDDTSGLTSSVEGETPTQGSDEQQVDPLVSKSADELLVQKWDVEAQKPHIEKAIKNAAEQEALEQEQKKAREAAKNNKVDANEAVSEQTQSEQAVSLEGNTEQLAGTEKVNAEVSKPATDNSQKPLVVDNQPATEDVAAELEKPQTGKVNSLKDKMDNPWFMQQNRDNLTLQLTGVSNQNTLQSYLNFHKLGDKAHIYQSVRNGKPWYVVTYGSYQSIEQANTAKAELPQKIRAAEPWAKHIRTIQAEILDADKKD